MPLENRRDVLVSTAVAADRLGYDGYYLPETWAYDTTIVLAEAEDLRSLAMALEIERMIRDGRPEADANNLPWSGHSA